MMHGLVTARDAILYGVKMGSAYRLRVPTLSLHGGYGQINGSSVGSSLDFLDYRDYHPGDDLRHIDWSVMARSRKKVVRLYREEISPTIELVLDMSMSMGADSVSSPSTGKICEKSAATLVIAAMICTAAVASEISTRLWLFLPPNEFALAPWSGANSAMEWDLREFPMEDLRQLRFSRNPNFVRKSIRILLSDLLWEAEPKLSCHALAPSSAHMAVLQILASEEIEPHFTGFQNLVDSENSQMSMELSIDSATVERYKSALLAHTQRWSDALRGFGASLNRVNAGAVLDGDMTPLLKSGLLDRI